MHMLWSVAHAYDEVCGACVCCVVHAYDEECGA